MSRRTPSSIARQIRATLTDEQRGGFGTDTEDIRSTRGINGSVQWSWNQHTFKGGAEWGRLRRFLNATTVGGAVYTSMASSCPHRHSRRRLHGFVHRGLGFDPFNTSDFSGFIATINGRPTGRSSIRCSTPTVTERSPTKSSAAALRYNSTSGNPNGQVQLLPHCADAGRRAGFQGDGTSLFFQDTFRVAHFTFNLGVRTEQWKHFASEGTKIFTFDWALGAAPIASVRRHR